jgi:hypothetical protein
MSDVRLHSASPFVRHLDGVAPAGGNAGRRIALLLSAVVGVLMLVASVAGLIVDGLYRDPPSTASMLRGFDLVTLVVVVPALAGALLGVRRRSPLAELVWVGLLAAVVYTYALYVFGTAFNDLFVVHIAVFSGAMFGLVLALASLDMPAVIDRLRRRAPARLISAFLALLALGLGGMWIYASLWFAGTGQLPAGSALVETDQVVHLGIALDLALLVPAYAAGCVLLWRQAAWGYVIAALVLVSGVVHQVGYLVALPFQASAGVPGAVAIDAAEPVIAVLFLTGTVLLLRPLRKAGP